MKRSREETTSIYDVLASPRIERKLLVIPYKAARQRLLEEGEFLSKSAEGRGCMSALADPISFCMPALAEKQLFEFSQKAPIVVYLMSLIECSLLPQLASSDSGMDIIKRQPTLSYDTLETCLLVAEKPSAVRWLAERLRTVEEPRLLRVLTTIAGMSVQKLAEVYPVVADKSRVLQKLLCSVIKVANVEAALYLHKQGVSATTKVVEEFPGTPWNSLQTASYVGSSLLEALLPSSISGEQLCDICDANLYSDVPDFVWLASVTQASPEAASEAALQALDRTQRRLFIHITDSFTVATPAELMRAAVDGVRLQADAALLKDLLTHFGLCWYRDEETAASFCQQIDFGAADTLLLLSVLEEALSFDWSSLAEHLLGHILPCDEDVELTVVMCLFGYLPLNKALDICRENSLAVCCSAEIIHFARECENEETACYLENRQSTLRSQK